MERTQSFFALKQKVNQIDREIQELEENLTENSQNIFKALEKNKQKFKFLEQISKFDYYEIGYLGEKNMEIINAITTIGEKDTIEQNAYLGAYPSKKFAR